MSEKLNFFEWFERDEDENWDLSKPVSTKWIENYSKNSAWKSHRMAQAVHDGDCTNMPYTCSLCVLTDALERYRDYYFEKVEKL